MNAPQREIECKIQVCLGAQTTADRLFWLLDTIETWSAPISISVFTPGHEYHVTHLYVSYLRRCSERIRNQVGRLD